MSEPETFLGGRVTLHCGDSRDVLRAIPDASIHAVVTDPPYALVSIGKRFGKEGAAPAQFGRDGAYSRASSGFMGKQWDTGEVAFAVSFWREVLRVLKPGGHVVAFSGTRTYHRMACAIEDAGFEIRDQLGYLYGCGFPKSHNISKKAAQDICGCGAATLRERYLRPLRDPDVPEAERPASQCCEVLLDGMSQQGAPVAGWPELADHARVEQPGMERRRDLSETARELRLGQVRSVPAGHDLDGAQGRLRHGASPGDGAADRPAVAARGVRASSGSCASEQRRGELGALAGQSQPQDGGAWPHCDQCCKPIVPDGLGTALKPAWEPIVLARKPLDGTVAANVLAHGAGALNIDGCRIEAGDKTPAPVGQFGGSEIGPTGLRGVRDGAADGLGRWPANIVHDGSPKVVAAFPEVGASSAAPRRNSAAAHNATSSMGKSAGDWVTHGHADAGGSAARFFYSAKADDDDRLGSKHPTVKPVDLMQWLCRLVCPSGGVVLDPFAGTGTTGEAAWREGFSAVLVEREAEYQADIRRRMKLALGGPDERKRESIKARHGDVEAGPLFSNMGAAE